MGKFLPQVDDERVLEDIEHARVVVDGLQLTVIPIDECQWGEFRVVSHRTGKTRKFSAIDNIDYLEMVALAGPAFMQQVARKWNKRAAATGKIPFEMVLEAMAVTLSCSQQNEVYIGTGERDG